MAKTKIKKESAIFDEDENPFDSFQKKVNRQSSEELFSASEVLDEYCKFSSGKNDHQDWVERNRVIYGKPFRYDSCGVKMMLGTKDKQLERAPRPYQRQIINDRSSDKSIIKCRQSEQTETEVNDNIWIASTIPHAKVRHLFPTMGMGQQIAKEKISPAQMNSPNIRRLIKHPFNLTSKSYVNGSFYTIDGSWTDHGGRGPSSDKITFDEYETQNPQIEEIYSESLSHSAMAKKCRISTPLLPNSGIDLKFQQGCMYEWYIVCPKCKKRQMMSFPENLIGFFEASEEEMTTERYLKAVTKSYIGCKYCEAYIDKTSKHYIKTSRWIPQRKHLVGLRASYRITYMMLAWKTGVEILTKYHSFKFKHQFWNEIMGYSFVDPAAIINRGLFERNIDNSFKNEYRVTGQARNVSVGVDWGMTSWAVVRANGFNPDKKSSRVIYMERIDKKSLKERGYDGGQLDHAKRVADISKFFRAKVIVNDANGIGVDRNAYLVKKFPTRAWGCFYDTDEIQKQKKKRETIEPQFSQKSRRVVVSRVGTFKLLMHEYEEDKSRIPALDPTTNEFIDHHANIVIQFMADSKTGQVYEIVGNTGPDHYAHADNYAKIGFDSIVDTYQESNIGVVTGDQGARADKVNVDDYVNPDMA
jgi:hypothetical protein